MTDKVIRIILTFLTPLAVDQKNHKQYVFL